MVLSLLFQFSKLFKQQQQQPAKWNFHAFLCVLKLKELRCSFRDIHVHILFSYIHVLKYIHDNFFMNIYSTKNTFKYTIELSIIPPIKKKKKIQEISI